MFIYIRIFPLIFLNPLWLVAFILVAHPFSVFATNLIFTLLITGRLIYHQRRINRLMGPGCSSQYTAIVTIIIESASINVVFQLLSTIRLFVRTPEVADLLSQYFLGQTQVGTYTFLINDFYESTNG
jgi:hypothetical protein